MKKFLAVLVALSVLSGVTAVGVGATFGTGVAVVASEVKLVKTGLIGQRLEFSEVDFKSALYLSDFGTVTVTRIPSSTEGTLMLSGRRVGEGRSISRRELSGLCFIPASEQVCEATFGFKVDGYAGGAELECVMRFIDKVNYAPTAGDGSDETVRTQAEIGVIGNLSAKDPEGDAIEFVIVSYPTRGRIELIGEGDRYCYTPMDGFVGNDKFSYAVRDEYGNWSRPVTVNLRVNRRMCGTVYRDMIGREEYNAAVAMTAMGVMSGTVVGDDSYFSPDEAVSRAEFVTMAMKCAGIGPEAGLAASYFDDDGDIPVSLRGYVATAQRMGLVVGDFKDGRLVFGPNEEITRYEAAKIMALLIDADRDGEEEALASDERVPVWARAGVVAMCSLGIFDSEERTTEVATRGDVAGYLYRLTDYIK